MDIFEFRFVLPPKQYPNPTLRSIKERFVHHIDFTHLSEPGCYEMEIKGAFGPG